MKQPQIEITADGSATLYIPEIDEHYHSVKGALTESLHIFIQTGFHYSKADPLIIFEVGFGTGLNAFLTLLESEKFQRKTVYHTIELYPLQNRQTASNIKTRSLRNKQRFSKQYIWQNGINRSK